MAKKSKTVYDVYPMTLEELKKDPYDQTSAAETYTGPMPCNAPMTFPIGYKCQMPFGHDGDCQPPKGRKFDQSKMRPSLLPWLAIKSVIQVLEYGAKKYAPNNWRGVTPERYADALHRHMIDWQLGTRIDEESGLPTMAHIATNALFVLWFDLQESKDT